VRLNRKSFENLAAAALILPPKGDPIPLRPSWPSSLVRKSDHDCVIEIDYFGLR